MEEEELKWGILGCGRIAHDFARAMRNCKRKNRVSFLNVFILAFFVFITNLF